MNTVSKDTVPHLKNTKLQSSFLIPLPATTRHIFPFGFNTPLQLIQILVRYHGKREGKQTGELRGNPSSIAIREGAMKFRAAVEKYVFRNMCSTCHCHSENANPF